MDEKDFGQITPVLYLTYRKLLNVNSLVSKTHPNQARTDKLEPKQQAALSLCLNRLPSL
jgi:hypothetical protein